MTIVLPPVKHKPARAVVGRPINKLRTFVPSDMSCAGSLLLTLYISHLWKAEYASNNTEYVPRMVIWTTFGFLVGKLIEKEFITDTSLLIEGLRSLNVL